MMLKATILLVDDNENDRFLWAETIKSFGYVVQTASGGKEALQLVGKLLPDLILLDLKMPGLSGLEVSQKLRSTPRFRNIPVIMLTSSDDLGDKIKGFEQGIDDYITKEMDQPEIKMRIEAVLKRYRQSMDSNPLTHLPGNNAIQFEIAKRLENNMSLAVAYCDLDNFKAFNDAYGFMEGDRAIRLAAQVLQDAVEQFGNRDDFVGHIGGDDFIFLTTPQKADVICRAALKAFESQIKRIYPDHDVQRGYFVAIGRQGKKEKFPIMSMSIAVVTNRNRPLTSLAEISRIASELKKLAKSKTGNVFVVDRRHGDN